MRKTTFGNRLIAFFLSIFLVASNAAVSAAALDATYTRSYMKQVAGEGVNVEMTVVTADETMGPLLDDNSKMNASELTSGDQYEAARSALQKIYSGVSEFRLFDISIVNKETGSAFSIDPEKTTATVTVDWEIGDWTGATSIKTPEVKLYEFDGENLTECEVDRTFDASLSPWVFTSVDVYETNTLNKLVFIDTANLKTDGAEKDDGADDVPQTYTHGYAKQVAGEGINVEMTVVTTDETMGPLLDGNSRMEAEEITSGHQYDAAKAALEKIYSGVSEFRLFDISIIDRETGSAFSIDPEKTTATVTVDWEIGDWTGATSIKTPEVKLYEFDGENLTECEVDRTFDASLSPWVFTSVDVYETNTLNKLVFIDTASLETGDPGKDDTINLEPGEYTVTANMYVPGEENTVVEGLTAYLTNLGVPPDTPVERNALLTVGEDKSLTLTISDLNSAFTLQRIEAADDSGMVIQERIMQYAEDYPNYNWGKISSRIQGLKIKLNDTRGTYYFSNCIEYPLILEGTAAEGYKEMPIVLSVDFASAEKGYVDSENTQIKAFANDDLGIKVTVYTSEQDIIDLLNSATMQISKLQNSDYKAIVNELYGEEPPYSVYSFTLMGANGKEIELSGNSKADFTVNTNLTSSAVYKIGDAEVKEIRAINASNIIAFSDKALGTFLVAEDNAFNRWNVVPYESDTTDVQYAWREYGRMSLAGVKAIEPKIVPEERGTQYYIGFLDDLGAVAGGSGFTSQVCMTLPYQAGQNIYIVVNEGKSGELIRKVDLKDAVINDGRISFILLSQNSDDTLGKKKEYESIITALGNAANNINEASVDKGFILVTGETLNETTPSENTGGSTPPTIPTDKTQTVTANLYLPGENNQVIPGVTVYLNNSNNPIQGTGTPTTPESNNAKLTTAADGTKTLTLSITNPVFTLQDIGSCSNARIIDTKTSSNLVYQGGATGKYSTRISEITVELLDDSGEYVFDSCTEFPTLLGVEWNYPLILAVNFDGGKDDSLDSNDNVDVSGVTGGNKPAVPEETPAAELNPTVTAGRDGVANVEFTNKNLDAALEQVQENGGAIVIQPEIEGEATRVNVDLPKSSVETMAKSDADLVVKTEIAAVSIPSEGLAEIAKANGSTVTVSTEKKDDTVAVNIAVGGKTVEEIRGGVTVTVSAPKQSGNVLVLVGADGTETVVKKSVVDGDTVKALLDGSATVKVVDHSKSFSDTANHWAKDSIAFASSHELFQGVSDSQFAPDTNMSRAMLATVLYRLEDAVEKGDSSFTDVAEGAWYADGVAWANENGIVSGYGNGVFAPNDDITREQLVVMLYRYAQHLGMDTKTNKDLKSYSDADTVSSWATDAMKWAVDKGLIAGRTNSTLAPGGTATRAETATILQRMVELMVK